MTNFICPCPFLSSAIETEGQNTDQYHNCHCQLNTTSCCRTTRYPIPYIFFSNPISIKILMNSLFLFPLFRLYQLSDVAYFRQCLTRCTMSVSRDAMIEILILIVILQMQLQQLSSTRDKFTCWASPFGIGNTDNVILHIAP